MASTAASPEIISSAMASTAPQPGVNRQRQGRLYPDHVLCVWGGPPMALSRNGSSSWRISQAQDSF